MLPHHFLLSCQISLVTLMSYSADLWTYPRADLRTGIKRRVVESCKRVESVSSMFRVARALQSWQDGCGTWSGDLLIGSAWSGVAGGAGESGSSSSIIVGSGLSVICTFFVCFLFSQLLFRYTYKLCFTNRLRKNHRSRAFSCFIYMNNLILSAFILKLKDARMQSLRIPLPWRIGNAL